jgi:hypothetical protein
MVLVHRSAEVNLFLFSGERPENKSPQANGYFLLDLYNFKPYKHAQHQGFILSVLSTERITVYFLCDLCVLSDLSGRSLQSEARSGR